MLVELHIRSNASSGLGSHSFNLFNSLEKLLCSKKLVNGLLELEFADVGTLRDTKTAAFLSLVSSLAVVL